MVSLLVKLLLIPTNQKTLLTFVFSMRFIQIILFSSPSSSDLRQGPTDVDLYSPDEVRPKEALRFAFIREQGFDRSCGYSTAASVLSLYWGQKVDEREIVERYANDKLESEKFDVTFFDLARIFADFGFSVKGYKMTWAQLESALIGYAPILIHYARPDRHFALALYAKDDWIIMLDPAMGCELLRRGQFEERWSGAALVAFSPSASRDDVLLSEAIRVEWDRLDLLERLGQ